MRGCAAAQGGEQIVPAEVDPESVVWGVPQTWTAVQRLVASREDAQGCDAQPHRLLSAGVGTAGAGQAGRH